MKKLNYTKLMANNPTKLGEVVNQIGQLVEFYEHPIQGDESPVIAVVNAENSAAITDFYDLSDFYDGSDYNPVCINGKIYCTFEFNL